MPDPTDPAESVAPRPDADSAPTFRRAWRCPKVVVCFVLIFAGVLTADLLVKYWSFRTVAGEPLYVDHNADIWIYVHETDQWLKQPRLHPDEPASAIPAHGRPNAEPYTVIPGLLELHLTLNTGAVFGLGSGGRWVFVGISILAVGVILFLFVRSPARAPWLHLGLALILAGALGNLYDRVRYGVVRDMFHLFPEQGYWPWIWNLADAVLMAGVGIVMVLSFKNDVQPPKVAAQAEAGAKPKPKAQADDTKSTA